MGNGPAGSKPLATGLAPHPGLKPQPNTGQNRTGNLKESTMIRNADAAKRVLCVVAAVTLLWTPSAYGKTCTSRDADAAETMVDHLDSWAKISETFAKYGHCDDGSIAEGNSEGVARLLVDHWSLLPQLGTLIEHNQPLKAFVLRHLDATINPADLDKIVALATSSCPSGMDSLCQDLKGAASQAAEESKRQVP